ncbi:MAG: hypothetical protein RLZZ133_1258, partial [Pseudomonadota bacterium]
AYDPASRGAVAYLAFAQELMDRLKLIPGQAVQA